MESDHGKKSGVFRFRKRAANLHKTRHLRAFSVVHQPENPRFSKCFRVGEFAVFVPLSGSFPVLQTPENVRFLAFTGRLTLGKRLVNQLSLKFSHWKSCIFPCLPEWLTPVNVGKRSFSSVHRAANARKKACIPTFTDVFVVFSRTFGDGEFKKRHVFQRKTFG